MGDTANLYVATHGLYGRSGGPYLDDEERRVAEERRAIVEGRDPDYDHPGSTAGTVLVNASQLLAAAGVNVPATSDAGQTAADEALVQQIVDSDSSSLEVYATVPVDSGEEVPPETPPADTPTATTTKTATATKTATPTASSS